MARNAPPGRPRSRGPAGRRPPARPGPGRRPPSRPPLEERPPGERDEDLLGSIRLPAEAKVALTRQELRRRRDLFVVFVLTPAVLLATALGVFAASQVFYPDREALVRPRPTAVAGAEEAPDEPTRDEPIVLEAIDRVRLSTGVVEKPPTFEWPEIAELKVVAEPSRPNEQADYTPLLSATELRRQIEVMSVNLTLHTNPTFAQGAAGELTKSYPLRRSRQRVVDSNATLGYIADDTGIGLVFTVGSYRVQIETIAAVGPIKPSQRAALEYHTLHLGDHVARRIQELSSQGRRSGLAAAAVHWRDHLSRSLPFGR
ncbi:MAG TPA: hypothetical protein VG370_09940 [Chloroflexota bacterium]|nr:hypothetical protein [Chloroflexota bacterium]